MKGIFGDDAFATSAPEQEAGGKAKAMGPPKPILAVWQVPAAKLSRGSKRSAIEAFTDHSELWQWLQEAEVGQMYRSELCSKEASVRSVGISRFAESYQHICDETLSGETPLKLI